MFKIIFKLIKYFNKVPFFIILFNYSINCLEKSDYQDYGIYNNVANIISANQNQSISEQFRPSNWNSMENLRRLRKLENFNRYKRLQEYRNRLKDNDDSNHQNNYQNNYYSSQFKRRSDLDDDYYAPSFYSPNSQYGVIPYLPPAIQPIISVPATPIQTPAVIATQPSYYRRYRPSASRNYYHRIYPNSALRRRLASATSSSSNYETPAVLPYASTPSAHSYYYGTGLATPQTYSPPSSYNNYAHHTGFPNTHGLAHSAAEHDAHERTEVHSLLPIITVIGISAFMIPLLTTFFTAMLSSGGSCCQTRQKERSHNSMDAKNSFYEKAKDTWNQVEKAINKSY